MDWLLAQLPMFTRIGAAAYKPGIGNIVALCEALGNPHLKYPVVHIAGTNGKGSSSHSIASVLQEAGYKTGLHTSPHLKKFNERIRLNGVEWTDEQILQFVNDHQNLIEDIKPSYFEISVAMAFYAFAVEKVDIAVIETGLGGRLDSTNIVSPVLSLITN
ncbi:MAG: bifunctional folylpolyglutamate synthase/dihydrofolate synthase, partial [Flexibacteraceae bacterium]